MRIGCTRTSTVAATSFCKDHRPGAPPRKQVLPVQSEQSNVWLGKVLNLLLQGERAAPDAGEYA
jgi:hypothetical protein